MANDLLQTAWGIIANAGGGDWDRETDEWREAARRWRDTYHKYLASEGFLGGEPEEGT